MIKILKHVLTLLSQLFSKILFIIPIDQNYLIAVAISVFYI